MSVLPLLAAVYNVSLICSVSQIDSFWNTFVLSNDCESSMRAIVIDPPRFGVPAFWAWPAPRAVAAATPSAAVPASARIMRGLRAFTWAPSGGVGGLRWKGRVYSTQPLFDK